MRVRDVNDEERYWLSSVVVLKETKVEEREGERKW